MEEKQVTKSTLTTTAMVAIIACIIAVSVSYSHFMEAQAVEYNDGELFGQYLAAISMGVIAFVCLCVAVRSLLIKSGKIKVKNLEVI